jgi:CBS domain-containing protein
MKMKVSELMSREVLACRPTDSMERAAQIMWEKDCGCVPIVDAGRNVQGMITDRDLCMAAYIKGQTLRSMSVAQAMSNSAACCRVDDDVEDALQMMAEKQLHRLPVVNDGEGLVGMLSLTDILQSRFRRKHLDEVLETMVAVTCPRHPHEVQTSAKRATAEVSI